MSHAPKDRFISRVCYLDRYADRQGEIAGLWDEIGDYTFNSNQLARILRGFARVLANCEKPAYFSTLDSSQQKNIKDGWQYIVDHPEIWVNAVLSGTEPFNKDQKRSITNSLQVLGIPVRDMGSIFNRTTTVEKWVSTYGLECG